VGLAGVYLAIQWFRRQSDLTKTRAALSAIGLGLIFLAIIGRLPWVLGLFGGLLPIVVLLLSSRHRRNDDGQREQESTGGQSVVETRFLRMTLDHETGEMVGKVLAGRFTGSALEALSLQQLLDLLHELTNEDDESAALLRAYLDQTHGNEWQEAPRGESRSDGSFSDMTRSDAYAILGLEDDASREQIIAAHGRLIQRLHPDRGGSTFLAAKINQARDLLLEQ
jgi:hypothetical protein